MALKFLYSSNCDLTKHLIIPHYIKSSLSSHHQGPHFLHIWWSPGMFRRSDICNLAEIGEHQSWLVTHGIWGNGAHLWPYVLSQRTTVLIAHSSPLREQLCPPGGTDCSPWSWKHTTQSPVDWMYCARKITVAKTFDQRGKNWTVRMKSLKTALQLHQLMWWKFLSTLCTATYFLSHVLT